MKRAGTHSTMNQDDNNTAVHGSNQAATHDNASHSRVMDRNLSAQPTVLFWPVVFLLHSVSRIREKYSNFDVIWWKKGSWADEERIKVWSQFHSVWIKDVFPLSSTLQDTAV